MAGTDGDQARGLGSREIVSSPSQGVVTPTFSDDGRTLFVNIQMPGITLAITGRWATYLS